jgi:ABC-type phosphate transport system substrate-binding protein
MKRLHWVVLLGLLAATGRPISAADSFAVIVNAANPVAVLPASEVSRFFLRTSLTWQDGSRVMPIDLPDDAAARRSFSQSVHGRSASAVKAYWQKMIFSGKGVPPIETSSAADVVNMVRSDLGAIGYVPAGTPLGDGVKVLRITR